MVLPEAIFSASKGFVSINLIGGYILPQQVVCLDESKIPSNASKNGTNSTMYQPIRIDPIKMLSDVG
jgi:hypothetical protein